MLGKTSVSMMMLLITASLIGIVSIHQYVEGQTPPPASTPKPQPPLLVGKVTRVVNYASSDDIACMAVVKLGGAKPIGLQLQPGESVALLAPDESFCNIFGLSLIGKINIAVVLAQNIATSSLPSAIRADTYSRTLWDLFDIYRVVRVDMASS